MDMAKALKCIICMLKVGKCLRIVKKIVTVATFILIFCTTGKCLLDKKVNVKALQKKLRKVMQ